MRILVTGTNGPLGFAVKDYFNSFGSSLECFYVNSEVANLLDAEQTYSAFKKIDPTHVLHLAAKSGAAILNKTYPVQMFNENITMATNVLNASVKQKVEKVVITSSTAAYPTDLANPSRESDLHSGPPNANDYPYAYAKRMIDILAKAYRSQYGLQTSVAVVNGIVGPNMNFKEGQSVMLAGLIKRFYDQKNKNDGEFLVFGDGTPVREYTYSFDLAKALFWILSKENAPELINIGNSKGCTIKQYAEYVASALQINLERIVFSEEVIPGKPVYNQRTDNSKFLEMSFFEYTDIEDSIRDTVTWYVNSIKV